VPVRERQRTVYVPYEELEKVFKDGGKGVFLPYREFLDLWNELSLKREEATEVAPPADAVLMRAEYTGKVENDSLILEAKLSVESFKKGWVQLPLLNDAALPGIGEAVTGKAILSTRPDGADLLLPEKGVYEITLKIYAPVIHSEGKARVKLNLPRAAVSRLTMSVPGEGLDFVMEPAAAYTTQAGGGQTQFSSFFGSGESQEITWSAKAVATTMTPLILANTKMSAQIGVGSLSTTADVAYRILRAPVSELRIGLPADQEIIGVTGIGIREWKVETGAAVAPAPGAAGGGKKTLVVLAEKPWRDDYALRLALESPIAKLPAEVRMPELEIMGAAYARGEVVVRAETQLDTVPKTLTAATRTQAANAGAGEVGVFRLLKQPYQLTFQVAEAVAQVEVTSQTKLDVLLDSVGLEAQFTFKVRRVGIFEARIGLPAYWVINDVKGTVDQWNVETGTGTAASVLVVKLPQQKMGEFQINVRARLTRANATNDLILPVFTPQNVTRHEATIGVGLHSSLEANTKEVADFQQEDVSALSRGGGTPMSVGAEPTLAFRYRDAAKPAVLTLKGRNPQVSVEVLTLVEAREQSTRHSWTLAFDVAYAATDRFVLAVPKEVANEVRFVDPQIKEINKTYQPAAPPVLPDLPNYVLWEVVLRSERMGSFSIRGSHEKIATLASGKTADITLLQVHVPGAFQETGQVAVVKADSLEIRKADAETLEEMDARELNSQIARAGVFLAYKYRSLPIKLRVELAKNSYFAVPQAMVTHADLITAVATDQAQTTEAVYWVKNNDLQFLVVRLPQEARLVSDVFVNREPQQPMRREGSADLLVRLPSGGSGVRNAFPVRLVFEVPSPKPGQKLGFTGSLKVFAPNLADVGVLETRHRLYLPDGWHYTNISGPLTRAARERGWARARKLIDPLIPAFGPQLDTLERSVWRDPPLVANDTRTLFGLQVPQQGHLETLRRLGPPAEVVASFRSKKATFALEALAFLAAFLAGLLAWRTPGDRRPATEKTTGVRRSVAAFADRCGWWQPLGRRALYVVVFGFGAMLLTGIVGPANVPVLIAMMLGVVVVVGVWAAQFVWRTLGRSWAWWRNRQTPRPPVMPPPLNPTPPTPPTAA
jgi:hypothetical protein